MRLLVSWVRDFVGVTAPPDEIADRLALRGFEVSAIESAPDGVRPPWPQVAEGLDGVIDFEVTANRPDCLSVLGFAREIATLYRLPLHDLPPLDAPAAQARPSTIAPPVELDVQLEDAVRCPRYAAAVASLGSVTAPRWLTSRLQAAGVRSISAVVDVTNYVLLELGHPMHAFDLERLGGGQIRIRQATPGETIVTLDGVPRALDTDMLVIADATRAQAVAGVMGGASSEVSSSTRWVAFESAYFEPTSVRRTSKHLGLKTEASARFERGADISAPVVALERALSLTEHIGAGRRAGPVIDRYPSHRTPSTLGLRRPRIARILGTAVPDDDVARILGSLGLTVHGNPEGWTVEVPTFRVDLQREVDLIEEVGRHHGFEKLEPTFPAMRAAAAPPDARVPRDRRIRAVANAAGLSEAVTFGFIERSAAATFAGTDSPDSVALANPLSTTFGVLRPSLLPALVDAVAHNRRHGRRDVALFEIGSRFTQTEGERRSVACAWTGSAAAEHWSGSGREVDFFDIKGLVERLAEAVGAAVRCQPAIVSYLVPGHAASVTVSTRSEPGTNDVHVGTVGWLLPAIAEARGAPRQDRIYVAELDLDAFSSTQSGEDTRVLPLPRFPSVVRDLSVVVPQRLSAESIHGTIQAAAALGRAPLTMLTFFDRYKGKGVADDAVSVSVRLTFQAPDRTLTDADVQQSLDTILAALAQAYGAVQR